MNIRRSAAATCLLVGATLLALAGWEWGSSRMEQRRLESELAVLIHNTVTLKTEWASPNGQQQSRASPAHPLGESVATAAATDPPYEQGQPIARLEIPRIGVRNVVVYGTSERSLGRGPGLVERTAFPGDEGNAVIAAHRDYFFWRLRELAPGDTVTVSTMGGNWRYIVKEKRVINETDVDVLAPTAEPTVTLITCWPLIYAGHTPERLVVTAVLTGQKIQ